MGLGGSVESNLPAVQEMRETWVQSLDREDPLEQEMATCSSILAWKIPWTEEPRGLPPMGPQRVGHDNTQHTRTHWQTQQSVEAKHKASNGG